MRTIDADLLRKEFPMPEDVRDPKQCLYHVTGIWAAIDAAPTVEERKEGTWIKMSDADGEYYACSECGEDLPRHIDRTHYCPNCGSHNRGERDER